MASHRVPRTGQAIVPGRKRTLGLDRYHQDRQQKETASLSNNGCWLVEIHFQKEGTRRCKVGYQHLLRSGN